MGADLSSRHRPAHVPRRLRVPDIRALRKGGRSRHAAIELDEDFGIGIYQLSFNAAYLNRLDLSEHALQQASERKLDVPESLLHRYDLAFLKHDQAAMERPPR